MTDDARIDPAEAHAKMTSDGFTYVDVRTEEEFAEGHPAGACNVPFLVGGPSGMSPNADFVAVMSGAFAKDTPLVLGCKAGARSAKARAALVAAGFTNVLDQRAGWDGARGPFGELTVPGWSRTSLPTEGGLPEGRRYADLRAKRA